MTIILSYLMSSILPLNINSSSYDELMSFFDNKKIASDIIKYRTDNGLFLKKQSISKILGKKHYNEIKSYIVISLPSTLLAIDNDHEFLDQLSKYNNDSVNLDICKLKLQIASTSREIGYNYILHNPDDKHVRWYKVGLTSREPEIRAREWKYDLRYHRITSCSKIMERLLHKYLDFAHSLRKAMSGKGKNEVEWFYISYKLLVRTMDAVINTCDPWSNEFTFFEINRLSDLSKEHINRIYRKHSLSIHPDKHQDEKELYEEKFKSLTARKDKMIKYINKINNAELDDTDTESDVDDETDTESESEAEPKPRTKIEIRHKETITAYDTATGKKYHHINCRFANRYRKIEVSIDMLIRHQCYYCFKNFGIKN